MKRSDIVSVCNVEMVHSYFGGKETGPCFQLHALTLVGYTQPFSILAQCECFATHLSSFAHQDCCVAPVSGHKKEPNSRNRTLAVWICVGALPPKAFCQLSEVKTMQQIP